MRFEQVLIRAWAQARAVWLDRERLIVGVPLVAAVGLFAGLFELFRTLG